MFINFADVKKTNVYMENDFINFFSKTLLTAAFFATALVGAKADDATFRDIKVDLTNGNLIEESEKVQWTSVQMGISVAEDGTLSRVASDATDAACVIKGKWHSDQYGWAGLEVSVPVAGCVKVTYGLGALGSDVTIKNGDVVVKTFSTKGDQWSATNSDRVVSVYYKGEATTLTFTGGSYSAYFAVEAVDESDVPSAVNISFAKDDDVVGVVPSAMQSIGIGEKVTLPSNYTLYVEGKTLTGWSDGTTTYPVGSEYTAPNDDVELKAVFTDNAVSLSDRQTEVAIKWDFQRKNGAPTISNQNNTGIYVAQANVDGNIIDVKLDFDTNNGGKLTTNNDDWVQINKGTKITIPSCKGAVVSAESYMAFGTEGETATTIDGQTDYTSSTSLSYTIASSSETIDIAVGSDIGYIKYFAVSLPYVEPDYTGKVFNDELVTISWPFASTSTLTDWTSSVAGAISVASTDWGTATINVGSRTKDPDEGLSFITFDDGGNTKLHWYLKPSKGLTFTPTTIKMYVQRFGTNKENGVVVSANVEGEESVVLGTYTARRANWADSAELKQFNWSAIPATLVNEIVLELTAEQQAALASGEGLHLYATTGLASGKAGGFADIRVIGKMNGTIAAVEKCSLSVSANIEEGGAATRYPDSDIYEKGTDVTLTAARNFGYQFLNWTNAAGDVVSTDAKFTLTLTANSVLTANFEKINTYELDYSVEGANLYMVQPSVAPTVVDGKNMYEEGTVVGLTANSYSGLVQFTDWSNGQTAGYIELTMDADKSIVANYTTSDIIAGWDFYNKGNCGRLADYFAQDNDAASFNLVKIADGSPASWLDKSTVAAGGYESMKGAAVNWTTGSASGDVGNYQWLIKANAEAFTDIKLQFDMLYNYNSYTVYNVDYSVDGGENWVNVGSVTMSGVKAVANFDGSLPEGANNAADLQIRITPDKSSSVDGTASANDGNAIAMVFLTGSPKLVNDGVAPVLVKSVPAEGANTASASGKIVLTFDERVKVADGATAKLGDLIIEPSVAGKTITFSYKGLQYSTEYTFTLAANSIGDLTDNMLASDIAIKFSTMTKPTVTRGLYDFVVPTDGSITEALKAANNRDDKSARFRIFVLNSSEPYVFESNGKTTGGDGNEYDDPRSYLTAPNVSFIGESIEGVVITNVTPDATWNNGFGAACPLEGIGKGDVLIINSSATNTYFQNLTIKTSMGDAHGRDIALNDQSNRTIFKDACLWGYQDTYVSNNSNGKFYFEGGVLRGRTDFLCGKGDVYYNQVTLRQVASGYLAVPSVPKKYGYIFQSCKIIGDADGVNGTYTLGRPWGSGTPIALFIDTEMEVAPSAIGWNEMSGGYPARFAEYNSHLSSGTVVDLSGRKTIFADDKPNNPILTAEEAAAYTLDVVMGQDDDWNPTLYTEQAPVASGLVLDETTNVLSWNGSDYALLYAITKDGNVVAFTTEESYDLSSIEGNADAQKWGIRAANEMGGLGENVILGEEPNNETSLANVMAADKQILCVEIFNLAGQKLSVPARGMNIVRTIYADGSTDSQRMIVK